MQFSSKPWKLSAVPWSLPPSWHFWVFQYFQFTSLPIEWKKKILFRALHSQVTKVKWLKFFSCLGHLSASLSLLACDSHCSLQKSYQKSSSWLISWCYSSLITLHLDYWNICLKYSRNSPAHLSIGVWNNLARIVAFSRKWMMSSHYLSAALHCPSSWPSQLSADLLSSSTHFTPTDARSYDSSDKIVPFSSILLKPSKRIPVDYLCFPWSRGRVRTDLLWDSGKVVPPPNLFDWLVHPRSLCQEGLC